MLEALRVPEDALIANGDDAMIEVEKEAVVGDGRRRDASGRSVYLGFDKGGS